MPENDTLPAHLRAMVEAAQVPAHLLLIEDDLPFCEMFNKLAEPYHVVIETINNGRGGLELASTKDFDRVFLDMQLNGMQGLEVFRLLKKRKPRQKVVIFSGHLTNDLLDEIQEIGFAVALHKPTFLSDEFMADMFGAFGIENKPTK